jgi:uncharacterized iron-regulated membrane protein
VKGIFSFGKKNKRLLLIGAHVTLGILALPFYLAICFSGLLISLWFYFPFAISSVYGENIRDFYTEAFWQTEKITIAERDAHVTNCSIIPLKPLVDEAVKHWPAGVGRIVVSRPPGLRPTIEVHQGFKNTLTLRSP